MNMWIYKGSSLQHLKQIWMEFTDFEVTVDFDNLFHCSIILMEKVCNLCVVVDLYHIIYVPSIFKSWQS